MSVRSKVWSQPQVQRKNMEDGWFLATCEEAEVCFYNRDLPRPFTCKSRAELTNPCQQGPNSSY
jgi:hypothetical protein